MSKEEVDRREALKRFGKTAIVLGSAAGVGGALWDRGGLHQYHSGLEPQTRDYRLAPTSDASVQLAISTQGTSPEELTRAAVNAMGGMKRFIARNDIVTVKPNIGWDRMPVHAANTNPRVVAEVVRLVIEAGAKRVVVTDASCNEPNRCFQRSGIWKAAYAAGADVILPAEHRFRMMSLRGEVLHDWPVYRPLVDADKVINIPVAKHHNLAKFTGAMKNWYGLLGGRRNRLHQNIDRSIADLATFMQPTLTIIDATRVLLRNGPQGGNMADAKDMNTVIAATDQVAADAYACGLIGVKRQELAYLKMAHERGLGTMNWETLVRREV